MSVLRSLLVAGALLASPPVAGAEPRVAAADTGAARLVDAAPQGPSAEQRLREIRRRIQAVLVYPPLARSDAVEGTALVRFDIERDGTLRAVVVHQSSGRPSLDRAALRAVAASAPLPWVYGRLEVPVRFELERRQ